MSVMEPQRLAQNRPRATSGFSFRSSQSKHSKSSSRDLKKEALIETHAEKVHLSSTTKANPNAAMTELQPVAAALEAPTLGSLRGGEFKDVYGNPITDPDLSNPTRRRTERPLETIRAFEAAIDGEYNRKRRESMMFRPETSGGPDYDYSSRRSSSYWGQGHDMGMNGSRVAVNNSNGPYYNQRGQRDSFYDGNQRNRFGPRQHSDPALSRYNSGGQGVYPQPNYGQSSATVNTGGSNGSASDQWHPSTDPSSENSSIDRAKGDGYDTQAQAHREPISEEGHYTYGNGNGAPYHPGIMGGGLPPVPPPKPIARRDVIRLGEGGPGSTPMPMSPSTGNAGRPAYNEQVKRKSWLKRTFSKKE